MAWTVEFVNATAAAELNCLPLNMRTRSTRFGTTFQDQGISAMRMPNAKLLSCELWEWRQMERDGIALAIYITASG